MGRNPGDLTIDRIDSSKGYEVGNVRPMEWYDNVSHAYEEPRLPGMDYGEEEDPF